MKLLNARRISLRNALNLSFRRCLSTSSECGVFSSRLVNLDSFKEDGLVKGSDFQIIEDAVSEEEERVLVEECTRLFRRRRYESGHWDDVIQNFREMERSRWSDESAKVLEKIRQLSILPPNRTYFPAVHVIDLAPGGFIKPHIDSVKFSGKVVAGLSLLSSSVMRLEYSEENFEDQGDSALQKSLKGSFVDIELPRRSFYVMSDRLRYAYTHEIHQQRQEMNKDEDGRRISIIFRDELEQ